MITSWTRYFSKGLMRYILTAVIVTLCLTPSTLGLAQEGYEEYSLRRTVLVEERTAIWCTACAEIDPELSTVAKSHGTRIAIIGIHVSDAFENDASRARIEYHNQTHSESYGTPTFFVDGKMAAEGYSSWSDVQKRILFQENNRSAPEELALKLMEDNFELPLPEYGQLTLMILEHNKLVPEGEDNPGEEIRDRVLVGMEVVDSSGNKSSYGSLELPDLWSLVLIHEPVGGGEPYGVVEITNQEFDSVLDENLMMVVIFGALLGALLVFIPQKISLNREEE